MKRKPVYKPPFVVTIMPPQSSHTARSVEGTREMGNQGNLLFSAWSGW
jgi:hypothetical protein